MESFTSERCFDWLRDERHVSLMMSVAATLNKKPSARKFAPFSMALSAERSVRVVPQPEQGIQTLTWPLREGEYAWQVRPAGPFAASPRSGTWSVRAIHTPF